MAKKHVIPFKEMISMSFTAKNRQHILFVGGSHSVPVKVYNVDYQKQTVELSFLSEIIEDISRNSPELYKQLTNPE